MLVNELFEDAWSGPNNAWHDQGSADQWYDGNDQWHSPEGAGATEELIETADLSDIITARDLIHTAMSNPANKHKYFEFLKHLRTKHGTEYSTLVHQNAAKMVKQR